MPSVSKLQKTIAAETKRLERKYPNLSEVALWSAEPSKNERGVATLLRMPNIPTSKGKPEPAYRLQFMTHMEDEAALLERYMYLGVGLLTIVQRTNVLLHELKNPEKVHDRLDIQLKQGGSATDVHLADYARLVTMLRQG